jgi:hypothetical protein
MQLRYLAIPHRPMKTLALVALAAAVATTAAAQGTAIVRGSVTVLGKGSQLAGVTVVAADSNDVRTTTRTDSVGVFRMRVRAPGRYQLAILQVGQMPTIGPMIEVIPEDTIDAKLQIPVVASDTARELNEVRVVGDRTTSLPRYSEFEQRRMRGGATRSITQSEIEKRNPISTWQMLTNLPSLKIAQLGGTVIARSMRVENARLLSDKPCYLRVMVDGTLIQENSRDDGGISATDLSQLPAPAEIHGIEVFAGPASIPPQYGGTGTNKWCGLIAIWTK